MVDNPYRRRQQSYFPEYMIDNSLSRTIQVSPNYSGYSDYLNMVRPIRPAYAAEYELGYERDMLRVQPRESAIRRSTSEIIEYEVRSVVAGLQGIINRDYYAPYDSRVHNLKMLVNLEMSMNISWGLYNTVDRVQYIQPDFPNYNFRHLTEYAAFLVSCCDYVDCFVEYLNSSISNGVNIVIANAISLNLGDPDYVRSTLNKDEFTSVANVVDALPPFFSSYDAETTLTEDRCIYALRRCVDSFNPSSMRRNRYCDIVAAFESLFRVLVFMKAVNFKPYMIEEFGY